MNDNILKAFDLLAKDILDLFKQVLESDVGVNRKVGKNTLKDSRLAKTATVVSDAPFVHLIVNDYIDFIESGCNRRTYAPEIWELRDWAKRKGIPSDNSTLRAIQYAIWRDGIMGRPIMKTFYKLLDKKLDTDYQEILYEEIIQNLIKYFNGND